MVRQLIALEEFPRMWRRYHVDGECKPLKVEFLKCLKSQGSEHIACKTISNRYLECRMDRGLMARAYAGATPSAARVSTRATRALRVGDDMKNIGMDETRPQGKRVRRRRRF